MRALITGSTGCLGSNLAAALCRRGIQVRGLRWNGAPTTALDGLNMELIDGDILDMDMLEESMQGVDWVFHVAAIADDWRYGAEAVYRTNVEGTRCVMTAAQRAGVKRVVMTGSGAGLGIPNNPGELITEQNEFNIPPHYWVYGHSKHLAEQVMQEFVAQGLDAVCVLPTVLMGPGDLTFIAGQLVIRVVRRELFPLPKVGGVNYIDVRDAAEAHVTAAERGRTGERYILGGHNMGHRESFYIMTEALGVDAPRFLTLPHWSLAPIARMVAFARKAGIKLPIERGRIFVGGKIMYYDNSKAVKELGLKTRPFAESVRDTFEWYAAHGMLESQGVTEDMITPALEELISTTGFHAPHAAPGD